MSIKSLDPRINRLEIDYERDSFQPLETPDQLETYEVFAQVNDKKPVTHVGIVHGATETLAFLEAKEQYGRRGKCIGMWIIKTSNIYVSPYAEINENIFDKIQEMKEQTENNKTLFSVFLQTKRGKQHYFIGEVHANNEEHALYLAKNELSNNLSGCNLWVTISSKIYKTSPDEKEIFETASEKQFREPLIYKIKDRITSYREKNNLN